MGTCIKDLFDYDLVKKCCRCGINSLKSIFHINKLTKDGYRTACKNCEKKYYLDNRDRLLNKQKIYNFENSDRIKEYNKQNRYQINENQKGFKKQNRSRINIYEKNRKKTDLN